MGWQIAGAALVSLLLIWFALVATLYVIGRREQDPMRLKDLLRLVPAVIRLLRRLAADDTLPRGLRIKLALLVGYLISPIDLVPDFIPIVGYSDDAIIVALALRSVARSAGADALDGHWPGTPEGPRALKRLAGVRE